MDKQSLRLDEYGKPRSETLKAGKGSLQILENDADINMVRQTALGEVKPGSVPDIEFDIVSPLKHKTTITRVAKTGENKYLVNLLSVGHEPVQVSLSHRSGGNLTIKDLMTSKNMSKTFELASEDVLLLEVEVK